MNFWMIITLWLMFSMLVINIIGQAGEGMPTRTFVIRVITKFLIMAIYPPIIVIEAAWDYISDRIQRLRRKA